MNTEIINIGDELLIGQVVNTNASWMAEQMNSAGFRVSRIRIIADDHDEIVDALRDSVKSAGIVLITGGLGPTRDDITKNALCDFFDTKLIFNRKAYEFIEEFFKLRGYPVTDRNRAQAEIPENCIPIPNRNGTAVGMWFERESAVGSRQWVVYISMPGVPYEMKSMMTDWVIPRLKERFSVKAIFHKTIMIQGIGESFLSDILEEWETALPPGITVAYLPQPGLVRLRLSGTGDNKESIRSRVLEETEKLKTLIADYIYGYDNEMLEEVVGRLLKKKGATVSTAESCTGGAVASLITRIPGSSAYFKGSVVAYSNDIKISELGVDPEILERKGAVSQEVVKAMAQGIQKRFSTDYAIATSGIAGPDGGSPEKPVGTTWIAVAFPGGVTAAHFLMGEDRERNIRKTAVQALSLLRKTIIQSKEIQ